MKSSQYKQLRKLFLPLHRIRYFPPQFILRNPIEEGVSKALNKGYEVAVIVYQIKNLAKLIEQFGHDGMANLTQDLKRICRKIIEKCTNQDDLIVLDYHFHEGFTLYIKMNENHEENNVYEINKIMNHLFLELQGLMIDGYPFNFDKGYMFIDKNDPSIGNAIYKARQQALIMAEKKIQSEYNEMVYEMSRVISKKDIRLLGQPIINMDTKQIQAWEILTRGPKGTNLELPLRLFSVAHQTGQLYDLEMIVVEKIFEKIRDTGCSHEIFMNCTPITLGNKRFVSELKSLLQQYPTINPKHIIIEMTEQETVENMKYLIENIKDLRGLGFRIALDDTGAGYSSLHSIGEILPEIIKIDRSVIQNIHENPVSESMLMGIMLIANKVGSRVVAEGIEKREEADFLTQHQVDFAQGYYYARPRAFNQQLLSSL
ncbi:EAL domain-containing protein [Niallia sp. Krafla_26]|uniref:EAL domain-containing protein n=1 Tax=Niallia sp. Krafla_26 TaxID=3064703 RepID=UPI003D162B0B